MTIKLSLRSIPAPKTIEVLGPVVPVEMLDAARQAHQLIEIAHRQAEEILHQARKNAGQIEAEAREAAFAREAEQITQVLDELRLHIQTQERQFSSIAKKVAIAAMQKIALQAPTKAKLTACISQLVDEISAAIPLKLHVSPGLIQDATFALDVALEQGRVATSHVPIVEDKTLAPGDAALVTATGARIQCKFETIVQRLSLALDTAVPVSESMYE
jgi:flagellar biosynthesis/type III secretory pathway protein FliH